MLASILTAKGIPNDLRVSLGHIWVDYPGKEASALENEAVQVAGVEDGRFFLHWPEDFDLGAGDLRAAGDPLDAGAGCGACCCCSPASLLIVLWNALARLLGAGRVAGDGLLPARSARRRLPAGEGRRPPRVRRLRGAPAARLSRRRRPATPRLRYARPAPARPGSKEAP